MNMSNDNTWSCEEKGIGNCKQPYGCHCKEITSQSSRITALEQEVTTLKGNREVDAGLMGGLKLVIKQLEQENARLREAGGALNAFGMERQAEIMEMNWLKNTRAKLKIKMIDDINAVAKPIKHCLDIKWFANNATLANAAIELAAKAVPAYQTHPNLVIAEITLAFQALTAAGYSITTPTEREAIRAAALNEASDHLLKHGWIGTTQQDILALATMPQGYSVVETPREFICESCHLRIDEGVKPECNF
jgi:hypothetical protein